MKKVIALALAVLMFTVFFACNVRNSNNPSTGDNTSGAAGDSESTVNTTEGVKKVPDDLTFDGHDFVMAAPIPLGYVVFVQEEDSEDQVDSAIYKRNEILKERFKINITGIECGDTGTHAQAFQAYAQSDDDVIDVFGIGYYQSGVSMITNEYVIPWNDVEYIDFNASYWDRNLNDSLKILGNSYYVSGAINIGALRCTYVTYFNKTIAEDNKETLGNLYQTVKDGKWTYELFLKYIRDYSRDNGDGVQDANDYYGLVNTSNTYMGHYYSANVTTANITESGVVLTLMNEKNSDIIDRMISLLNDNQLTYRSTNLENIAYIFFSDRALFLCYDLSSAANWRGRDSDFGILPMAKYDEDQKEYTTCSDQWGLGLCIPITAKNTSRTGAILETMAQLSEEYVTPAYYDKVLTKKLIRDEESEEMLDIIFKNVICDPGVVYCGDLNLIPNYNCVETNTTLSTWYATYGEILEYNISSVLEAVKSQMK